MKSELDYLAAINRNFNQGIEDGMSGKTANTRQKWGRMLKAYTAGYKQGQRIKKSGC